MSSGLVLATAPVTRRVRAFLAPVDRVAGVAVTFDAAALAGFDVDAPEGPWMDLGWCAGFARKSGTRVDALVAGAPGVVAGQVRVSVDAEVQLEFESWGKLQMALAAGVQQINVLSGAAVAIGAASTASSLAVSGFAVGDVVVCDVDYVGAAGFVGSGVSGGYVKSANAITDVDYVRRVSLNVARVTSVGSGAVGLGSSLLAGVPVDGMKVSKVAGFCDREGGSFFQEWSGLFVLDGEQGDRVGFFYPRLQSMAGAAETETPLVAGLTTVRQAGRFRGLPVKDALDGEMVSCYRMYVPAAMRTV